MGRKDEQHGLPDMIPGGATFCRTYLMPRIKMTLEQFQEVNRQVSLRKPRCAYCGFVLLGEEDEHLPLCKEFRPRGEITRSKRSGPPPPSEQTYLICDALGLDHFWESGDEIGTVACMHCKEESDVPMMIMMRSP